VFVREGLLGLYGGIDEKVCMTELMRRFVKEGLYDGIDEFS
jgi:hypothetical protein